MPNIQALADSLSTTYTNEEYPLGARFMETDAEVKENLTGVSTLYTAANWLGKGERTWIFIKATGAIAAGDLVGRTAGAEPFGGAPTAVDAAQPAALLGVADHAIASGSYGWVIAQGCCVVDSTTVAAAGAFLISNGASGTAGEATAGANAAASGVFGMSLEAKAAVYANGAQAYIDVL